MRMMSFAMTTPQFKARTKFVTRRDGWWNLKPGDVVMGIEKGMGLKKGEKVVRLGPIEIVSVRRELLGNILLEPNGCGLEGFPEWNSNPIKFIDFYCGKKSANRDVNRIEFRYLDAQAIEAAGGVR